MRNETTIIVEACQNHNGEKSILQEMIWAAKESGADIIKIQSIDSRELTYREDFENGSNGKLKRPYRPEFKRLKQLDLDEETHVWFIEECEKAKITPMTTIFTHSKLNFLAGLKWDAIKIASYDSSSFPLLERVSSKFKKMIISTGATYDHEIEKMVNIIGKKVDLTLLHCVTIYPTPLDQVNLRRMDWLKNLCPSVGYSDHSLVEKDNCKASKAAIFYGANVIERHFTVLDKTATKDGPVSINPSELQELVKFSRYSKEQQQEYIIENIPEFESMLGSSKRELTEVELINRDYYRGRFASKQSDEVIYNWMNYEN